MLEEKFMIVNKNDLNEKKKVFGRTLYLKRKIEGSVMLWRFRQNFWEFKCLHTRILGLRCLHTRVLKFRCLHTSVLWFRCLHTKVLRFRCLHTRFFRLSCLHTRVLKFRHLHTRVLWFRCHHTRFLRFSCLHTSTQYSDKIATSPLNQSRLFMNNKIETNSENIHMEAILSLFFFLFSPTQRIFHQRLTEFLSLMFTNIYFLNFISTSSSSFAYSSYKNFHVVINYEINFI
jgi:hypothetical protein